MLLFWVYFIQVIFFLFYFSKESLLWPSVIDQFTSRREGIYKENLQGEVSSTCLKT